MLSKISFTVVFVFFISFKLFSQNADQALITFEDESISMQDFIKVYQKNNSGEMIQKSTVDEYLDLYINFKLKVKEAVDAGYDTSESFITELDGYRKQLAQPYLSADGLIEELKKEAYARLEEEVRASHILISSRETDSPEDTLKAYQKALEVKKKLKKGEDFERLALLYSDDPSVTKNKGDLGYFSAFYMVYPFETAAYETKVGEISEITKTRFGYHILKVTDRRPNSGELTVEHILISSDPEISKIDDPEAKINEIYSKLEEGESFELLAKQFSDDTRTASNGGLLPVFGVGKMIKEFEVAAFALEKDGDYTKPVKTDYGYHIIKRIKKDEIGTYEEIEAVLDDKVAKDSRSNLTQSAVLQKIKNQYGFEEFPKALEEYYAVMDSSYFAGAWNVERAKKLNKTIFKIGELEVNQKEFTAYLDETQKGSRPISMSALINGRYKKFKEKKLLDYKNHKLEEEYPEFKALMQEYHDGILLFNLTNDVIWTKAVKDTTGIEAFYESNKENYKWGERIDATLYSVKDESIAEQVKSMIKNGASEDSIVEVVNRPSQLNVKYDSNKFEKGKNNIIDQVSWKKGISKDIDENGRIAFVHVKEVLKPTYKTLDDSRGIITSDYQSFLEKEWIKQLKQKYPYEVNTSVLEKVKQELE